MYYGFDYSYIILVLPAVILSIIAQILVKGSFSKEEDKYLGQAGLCDQNLSDIYLVNLIMRR